MALPSSVVLLRRGRPERLFRCSPPVAEAKKSLITGTMLRINRMPLHLNKSENPTGSTGKEIAVTSKHRITCPSRRSIHQHGSMHTERKKPAESWSCTTAAKFNWRLRSLSSTEYSAGGWLSGSQLRSDAGLTRTGEPEQSRR